MSLRSWLDRSSRGCFPPVSKMAAVNNQQALPFLFCSYSTERAKVLAYINFIVMELSCCTILWLFQGSIGTNVVEHHCMSLCLLELDSFLSIF